MRILLNYIQILGLFASLKVSKSTAVSGMTDGSALLSLSLRTFAVDCAITSDYYTLFYAHMVYTPILCLIAALIWLLILLVKRRLAEDKMPWPLLRYNYGNYVIMSAVVIANTTYPIVSKEAITALACRRIDDAYYLISFPAERCFIPEHWLAFGIGWGCFGLFSLGFPIVLGVAINRKAKAGKLRSTTFARRFAIYYRGYKESRAWWESVVSVRKLIMALIVISLSTNSKLQITLTNMFLFISIVTHVWFDPYVSRTATNVEMIALSALFLTLTGLLSIEYVSSNSELVTGITLTIITMNLLTALMLVLLIMQHHPTIKYAIKKLQRLFHRNTDDESCDSSLSQPETKEDARSAALENEPENLNQECRPCSPVSASSGTSLSNSAMSLQGYPLKSGGPFNDSTSLDPAISVSSLIPTLMSSRSRKVLDAKEASSLSLSPVGPRKAGIVKASASQLDLTEGEGDRNGPVSKSRSQIISFRDGEAVEAPPNRSKSQLDLASFRGLRPPPPLKANLLPKEPALPADTSEKPDKKQLPVIPTEPPPTTRAPALPTLSAVVPQTANDEDILEILENVSTEEETISNSKNGAQKMNGDVNETRSLRQRPLFETDLSLFEGPH
eukprot:TRINITY_DN36421_c0_g1_i1.p1 TRINITY_DN36421_c0_g1~~TRINITY_DN36421_c0_g1_i1.p1  ORF type:complete len:617 (-),score=13.62 TRINITY_DN36421_c0_g1_i1:94-1944(-)